MQANSAAKKPLLVGDMEGLCLHFGGLLKARRQDEKMHFGEKRESRQRAKGKEKTTLARGHSEGEKSICKDRKEKNAFAAARQQSDSEDGGLEKHGKAMEGKMSNTGRLSRRNRA